MLKVIAFDKDGTLLAMNDLWDEPAVKVANDLLAHSDMTDEEKEVYKREELGISNNQLMANSLFAAGSIADQARTLSSVVPFSFEEVNKMIEESYLESISALPEESIRTIDGVDYVLEELSKKYKLAVVTNDNYSLTKLTMQRAGVWDYFDFVACADEYEQKPSDQPLNALCEHYGVTPSEVVFVGDSTVDMQFGLKTRAAIGYADQPEHKEHLQIANYIIEDYNELLDIIEELDA